jgi:hypothetical protein
MKAFNVVANACDFGIIEAETAQEARDIAAQDAGYKSEADMVARLGEPSEIVVTEVATDVLLNGKPVDMAAARALMDDELCEQIHGTVETDQEFLDAYMAAHKAKFDEDFVLN